MAKIYDMALRYGGKVLVVHVYINTDRPPVEVVQAVAKAAHGEIGDAMLVCAEGFSGRDGEAVWREVVEAVRVGEAEVVSG